MYDDVFVWDEEVGCARTWFKWRAGGNSAEENENQEAETNEEKLHGQALLQVSLNKAAYCGFCIYLIVSLEQTIQRDNINPQEKSWTFGQVLAIILLLGVAHELLNALLAKWDRRKTAEAESE